MSRWPCLRASSLHSPLRQLGSETLESPVRASSLLSWFGTLASGQYWTSSLLKLTASNLAVRQFSCAPEKASSLLSRFDVLAIDWASIGRHWPTRWRRGIQANITLWVSVWVHHGCSLTLVKPTAKLDIECLTVGVIDSQDCLFILSQRACMQ